MKKVYETPVAEKVAFCYQEQVAASTSQCINVWINVGSDYCASGNPTLWEKGNV